MDFQLFETKLAKHKIFQDMKESLKNNFDNKLRNLLELKDDVLFAWNSVENCLYSVNLKRLEEDQEETPYQVMEDSNIKVSNGEKIKAIWTPVMTELGVCHTLNSVATADIAIFKSNASNTKDNPMTCQADTNGCFLYLECASQIDYYLHSPYDVVDYTEAHTTTSPPLIAHVDVTTTEIGVGPGVRALLPRRRQCLFTDEPTTASRQYCERSVSPVSLSTYSAVSLMALRIIPEHHRSFHKALSPDDFHLSLKARRR
ncbi:hypothetical protein KGM_212780 [Danaus plexippus plexippus]|uniref:Uncharacterized protein n=1 Tax=Danaus plexippus plexippus TaxID=278856 RepID=A0A212F221_DANPL|nr:hypothetical protein KGM_212780 [Danaus plexippus plexippus]